MIPTTKRFLLVDDDPTNNLLTKMVLTRSYGEIEVKDFTAAEQGLAYIESEIPKQPEDEKTTLLLDINMPTMDGWEFLEKFETFEESIKNKINIYILSSSVDPQDIQRAKINPLVIDFIEKPFNKAVLAKLFG